MEKLTEFVDGEEVRKALINWDRLMNSTLQEHPHYLTTFIKPRELISNTGHGSKWGWKVSAYNYRKIKMLASPHHYALLKIFKVQTGWQGKIPNEKA